MDNTVAIQPADNFDQQELKVPVRNQELDIDSLSEWELARMTSKTWSMEQD